MVGAWEDDTGGDARGAFYVLFLNTDGTAKSFVKVASGLNGAPPLADSDSFGRSVAAIGDLDGDGVADLAVGSRNDSTGGPQRGAVHVLFLNNDGSVKDWTKIASGTGGGPNLLDYGRFGVATAPLGDLDGDGVNDLAVGSHLDDTGGPARGSVHVLLLNVDGTVRSFTHIASGVGGGPVLSDGDRFGIGVASLGDLNGDGIVELAVGARLDGTGGSERGAVHLLPLAVDGTVLGASLNFTVTRSGDTSATSSIDFATSDGTATAGIDYVATSGSLTFSPGEASKTVTVPIIGDTIMEPDETVFVSLSNPTNATIADSQATGTILDPPPSFSIDDVSIIEGDSGTTTALFTVTRTGDSSVTVSVDYATQSNSATAPSDYVDIALTTLTFDQGETAKTIEVTINGDVLDEADEQFSVNLLIHRRVRRSSTARESQRFSMTTDQQTCYTFRTFRSTPVRRQVAGCVCDPQRFGRRWAGDCERRLDGGSIDYRQFCWADVQWPDG